MLQVLVALTSQYTETSSLSDHNILLANVDVPEYNTGLNKLLHSVQVRSCDDHASLFGLSALAGTCSNIWVF